MGKSYSELILLPTFVERFEYLKLDGEIGADKFGYARILNQEFYRSVLWKEFRRRLVVRDNGCDMALEDYPIQGSVYVHHINPLTLDDLRYQTDACFDPDNCVCVSFKTHQAITYGLPIDTSAYEPMVARRPNDQAPWR